MDRSCFRRIAPVFLLCLGASLFGCQSLTTSLDRMMPPWGPPEQWEPEVAKRSAAGGDAESAALVENYVAIFDAAAAAKDAR